MDLLAEGQLSKSGTDATSAPQQAQSRQNAEPRYHAFISYSRAADGRLAPVLQSALQRFAKPWYRRQILRIFRDQTSLEMTPDVWPEIRRTLNNSEFFILLASPEAARSEWVALEVEHWLTHKSLDRILIVLTTGFLVWDPKSNRFDPQRSNALPLPLLIRSKGLPNYADLTALRQSEQLDLKNPAFLDAVASLAARIHGRPKDELTGEEVRQHRRFRAAAMSAATLVIVLAAATSVAGYLAAQQRDAVLATTGRLLSTEAQRLLAQPITQETSSLIAALATTGWRFGKVSDAWNAMQRVPLVATLAHITHDQEVRAVAFSPDSKYLATASKDRTARIVAVADGREIARFTHGGAVNAVAFSPDSKYLATAGEDRTAWILAAADGREIARVTHDQEVRAVAFSSDGKYLATGGGDKTARIVAVADGRELARVIHTDLVWTVAFSPDSKYLATASWDGTARIVAVADGRELARVIHADLVWTVAFSPDSKYLATASSDKTAQIVAVADGRELARVTHDQAVRAVAFSPDSKYLATASWDGTARLWSTALDDMLYQLCSGNGRNLSPREWHRYFGDLAWQPTCKNWLTALYPFTSPPIAGVARGIVLTI
jgi:hypothetical protein